MRQPPERVFAWAPDAARATRTGGLLAVLASALGVVLSTGISRWPPAEQLVLLAMLAVVGGCGLLALTAPARMPPLAVVAALLGATVLLSLGMLVVGPAAVTDADNEMLYLLPVLFSAYFCRAWVLAAVLGTASLSYGAVLLAVPSAMPATRWVTTTAALALVATLVFLTHTRDVRIMAVAAERALVDPLTGLLNRRGLAQHGARLGDGDSLSLLLADIDHFKAVNDRHGHLVGDDVLVRVAKVLRSGLREVDVVARFGGEEFVLALPGCDAATALRKAQGLCDSIARSSVGWPAPVTLSIGVATGRRDSADLTALLAAADRGLYGAKAAGRNTVRVADAEPLPVVVPEQARPGVPAAPDRQG